jgi:hypothetical protein
MAQSVIYGYSAFSKDDMAKIRHKNVLGMFPTILKKLEF